MNTRVNKFKISTHPAERSHITRAPHKVPVKELDSKNAEINSQGKISRTNSSTSKIDNTEELVERLHETISRLKSTSQGLRNEIDSSVHSAGLTDPDDCITILHLLLTYKLYGQILPPSLQEKINQSVEVPNVPGFWYPFIKIGPQTTEGNLDRYVLYKNALHTIDSCLEDFNKLTYELIHRKKLNLAKTKKLNDEINNWLGNLKILYEMKPPSASQTIHLESSRTEKERQDRTLGETLNTLSAFESKDLRGIIRAKEFSLFIRCENNNSKKTRANDRTDLSSFQAALNELEVRLEKTKKN